MPGAVERIGLVGSAGPRRRGRRAPAESLLLEDFVAGPENRFAAFVCRQSESIAQRGNPLLLTGPVGAGKSTLATVLAASEAQRQEGGDPVLLPAVDFARRYADAVDGDNLEHLRSLLDQASVVMIDDVHLIADKVAAQEELASRIERRGELGRSTILTCRKLPTELRGIRPVLASRMLPGLTVPLALPGAEARRVILAELAAAHEVELDDESLELLQGGLPSPLPARQLAAAIVQLRLLCQHHGSPVDVQMIRQAIEASGEAAEPTIPAIAQAVARRFKLKMSELKGSTRRQQVVRARALAMFLGRKLTDRSLQQIGHYFGGRDHTTVLHACRKTELLLSTTPELSQAADEVTDQLRAIA